MMTRKLEGKVALITGGASGIGEAIAKIYAKEGCKVALLDIDEPRLKMVAGEMLNQGFDVISMVVDVVEEQQVIQAFKTTVDRWGKIDLVVNSAGRDSLSPHISETTLEEWNKTIGPNMTGVFLCCREAFRVMEKQQSGGRIMNIGSSSAKMVSCPGHSPYRASKHGMMGLSKNILLEGMNKNIGVTVINPSHVKTPMTEVLDSGTYDGGVVHTDGWLDEKELREGIYNSCIDVENVAEIALYIATRTPDVTVPTVAFYPTHKAHRYGMEV
ncbi:SDR family oxidoreductase [Budviciaceae bacterium CWB-B4]|uniref:SDR family oxidoreductase n=2 Tax=Limnobaculum xujianqingii TaxID=2738837 RepID=A0A9D7AH78_9GAMM|nr:SDR family oxidoreductase [Limnobaculum xujianqingii]MBK5175978.1 SDR family oxidoreductase [Limnobaculum xujianqingii]